MATELDPQIENYLHELSEAGVPPLYRLSVSEARETYQNLCVADEPPDPIAAVADRTVPGPEGDIPLRIYRSTADRHTPVLVFFHGGGWALGGLDTHDALCRALANEANCLVASVDYRRPPEHTFPAALEDCYAATHWIANNANAAGAVSGPIAVGGDSAGGTLATGVALLARDRNGPTLDYQVLAYPATNYTFDTDSYKENAQGYFLTRRDMKRFWDAYLQTAANGRHPYASPLQADDLSWLPPALVLTCGFDPLRDEGRAYAQRLADTGVSVRHREYGDVIHGFLTMLTDPELARARDGIEEIATALETAWND